MKTPLVSYCLFTYNQEKFILDAIHSAFAQTYENLEIIISDDCSTDGTYELVKKAVEEYKGFHIVRINRNEQNMGIAQHVNKVLYGLAKGEIIAMAAGDDVSSPNRVQVSVDFMLQNPEMTSLSCSSVECDADLEPKNNTFRELITPNRNTIVTLEDYVYFDNFILFPGDSRVIRRNVLDVFSPLSHVEAEDIALFFRSILLGSVGYIRQPLVKYRIYGGNVTSKKVKDPNQLKIRKDNTRLQFKEDLEIAIKNGYVASKFRPLVEKKIEYVLMWLYGHEPQKSKHSKSYNQLKRITKKVAKILFRE